MINAFCFKFIYYYTPPDGPIKIVIAFQFLQIMTF